MFEDFGKRLKKFRTAKRLSQTDLGECIGRGAAQIRKFEYGKALPTLEEAAELAFQLGVSMDELFGNGPTISTDGLTDEKRELIEQIIGCLRE